MDKSVYQVYEDEIQSLEEEIKLLAEKYEDIQQESSFFSDEEVLKSKEFFQREFQGGHKGHGSPLYLIQELESLERDLSFLMTFLGVQITGHSKKTLEKAANRTVATHSVSGKCRFLSFCLEFQLIEMQNMDNVSASITDLSIAMEFGQQSELSKLVSSFYLHASSVVLIPVYKFIMLQGKLCQCTQLVERVINDDVAKEHGSLLLFFRSLLSYTKWCEHRRCTFSHFKDKYPNIVALPEGQWGHYIILKNPQLPGFELLIVWKIHINEEGATAPVLDLLPKIPEQALRQKKAAVENAATHFRTMLRLHGIETAIETMIQVMDLEK